MTVLFLVASTTECGPFRIDIGTNSIGNSTGYCVFNGPPNDGKCSYSITISQLKSKYLNIKKSDSEIMAVCEVEAYGVICKS